MSTATCEWCGAVAGRDPGQCARAFYERRDGLAPIGATAGCRDREIASLRTQLARVTAERDEAKREATIHYERAVANGFMAGRLTNERDTALANVSGLEEALRLAAKMSEDQMEAVRTVAAQRDDAEAHWRRAEERIREVDGVLRCDTDCGNSMCDATPASWSSRAKAYRCAACEGAGR